MAAISLFSKIRFTVIALPVFLFSADAAAQASRANPSVERRLDDFNKQRDKVERDEMNREMVGRKPGREELRMAALKNARIRADLETLQAEYNEGVLKLHAKDAIDDAMLSKIAEKVHGSARRLREDMVFRATKPSEAKPPASLDGTPKPPRSVLVSLCSSILEFLTNPTIETPAIFTIADAEKARDTLDRILELSRPRPDPKH